MKFSVRKFLLIYLLLAIAITTFLTALGNYYLDNSDITEYIDSLMAISAPPSDCYLPNTLQTSQEGMKQGAGPLSFESLKNEKISVLSQIYNSKNELGYKIAIDDLYVMLLIFPFSGLLIWIIIGRGLGSLDRVAEEVANRAPNHLNQVSLEEIPEEIKPVIDELNKLFNRLKEGFEREKRFTADAAHELRTPLAALKAQAQVALNADNLQDKNLALEKLITSVNRSAHIVQQLITMSRLTAEGSDMDKKEIINFVNLVSENIAMMIPEALEKQIEIEFEHQDNFYALSANPAALNILIRNLLENSIRYSNVGDKIQVKIYQDATKLVLEIQDNGPGIPPELHDRVFERFFRIIGNQGIGSGLGLAIVKYICDLHLAEIKLDSPQEGSGLRVRIFFP